jgi:hypothetical protein
MYCIKKEWTVGYNCFEVGYYNPFNNWVVDSVYSESDGKDAKDKARRLVNYLNGGNGFPFDLGIPKKEETWDERLKRFLEDAKQARGQ